ncbi:NgoFVII family restriction endonuclease [Acetobacteraceae bacterium]|nr:NgoFVII family restriction endonuclease [Acetobacteraceae bacterium]
MFFDKQSLSEKKNYEVFLRLIGSLSNLFSDSSIPALYYRAAENIFCRAFSAENLSRGDIAVDAKKLKLGIGLKTFLEKNSKSFEKVAEFNAARRLYTGLPPEELIRKVAELRNDRIQLAIDAEGLDGAIYHCVLRSEKKFKIFEENMDLIDLNTINHIVPTSGSIKFRDKSHEYTFNRSKSTLLKRFKTQKVLYEFDVEILDDPLKDLMSLLAQSTPQNNFSRIIDTVYLPLYGDGRKQQKGQKVVFEKSGLNQWNARGRTRDANECYIPVPQEVHDFKPDFFPPKTTHFKLKLPNGVTLKVKLCQGSKQGKALMSDPNQDLGKWLLRDVLKVQEGELVNYQMLECLDIDCVRIDKIDESHFEMNFSKVGRYEEFIESLECM